MVEESRAEVSRSLAPMEEHLQSSGQEWLSKEFGIADLSIAPALAFAPMLGIDLGAYPHTMAWLGRVQARPAWKKVYG